MSIATAIQNAQQRVANAYTAVSSKGGTLPATQNLSNLPAAINSISTGIIPTGSYNITANGIYDVTNYANANVNVSGGASIGIPREVSTDAYNYTKYQVPSSNFTFSLPSNVTRIGEYALAYAFYNSNGLTSVDLGRVEIIDTNGCDHCFMHGANHVSANLTEVDLSSVAAVNPYGLQQAFCNNIGITTLDLSSLSIIGADGLNAAFRYCTGLTSVDLSALEDVQNRGLSECFRGCTNLTTVNLSSLTTVSKSDALNSAFYGCTRLTSIDLSSLTTVSGAEVMNSAFYNCTGLTNVLFTNLVTIGTNTSSNNYGHFVSCFKGCSNLTSITFPKLEKIYCTGGITSTYGTFANNNYVQKMYFPKLDTITYGSGASASNQYSCKNVFYGCSALTELHFGAANQAAIEASPGYSTAWGRGAGNVTIYFDL